MILKSFFRRDHLLIAVAISAGMFAQEIVSRITSASEHPLRQADPLELVWRSAETFYYSDCPAVSLIATRSQTVPALAPADADPSQAVVESSAPFSDKPHLDLSQRPPAIVARRSPQLYPVSADESPSISTPPLAAGEPAAEAIAASDAARTAPPAPPVEPELAGEPELATSALDLAGDPQPAGDPEFSGPALDPADAGPATPAEIAATEAPVADILPPPADDRGVAPETSAPLIILPPADYAGSPVDEPWPTAAASTAHSGGSSSERSRQSLAEQLVRQRAIERADLRRQRLESYRQMGYSPLRPSVHANPYFSGVPRPVVVVTPVIVIQQAAADAERPASVDR